MAQLVQQEEDTSSKALLVTTSWNTVVVALYMLAIIKACVFDVPRKHYSHPPTAQEKASLLSYLLYLWFNPVIKVGLERRVGGDDLEPLAAKDTCDGTWDAFRPYLVPFQDRISHLLKGQRAKATFSHQSQPSSIPVSDEVELTRSLLESDGVNDDDEVKEEKRWVVVR